MAVFSGIELDKQLIFRIEREFNQQMDDIIKRMQQMAENFRIAEADKKSPFRNVLSVANEPSSSLEVIKNYIRYQVGRKDSSPVWKRTKDKKLFATAVVEQIDSLFNDVEEILQRVKKYLPDDSPLNSYLEDDQRRKELQKHFHLKAVQLYLGYLVREHTAQVGYGRDIQDQLQTQKPKNT